MPVSQGKDHRDVTPTILDLVKSEIIDLMVGRYILLVSMLESIAVRRNRRNMSISNSESDIEIAPVPYRK